MPLDWLNTPLDADIGELIARKKRARAIDTLRRQLQGRAAPPVSIRLQLADLLMQAGRAEEAIATQKRALTQEPNFLGAYTELAVLYSELGREEEARAAVRRSMGELPPLVSAERGRPGPPPPRR